MTNSLQQNLILAISKLYTRFNDDLQSLHFAISIVFSAILKKHQLSCVIVGGQSAAYWMRLPGSTDVDFVSSDIKKIASVLEGCGFQVDEEYKFRYLHPATNVLIELVGEHIDIRGINASATVAVKPTDINDSLVKSLMPGPAEVLDPVLVFVNYLDSADQSSIWFNFEDEGALSIERAQALFALYKEYILDSLRTRFAANEISDKLILILRDKFNIVF